MQDSVSQLNEQQRQAMEALRSAFNPQTQAMERSRLPEKAMLEMGKFFGLVPMGVKSLRQVEGVEFHKKNTLWNAIIDALDSRFPEWRGFVIRYPSGGLG